MIPESHQNRTVDLYKFIEFPLKLEKVRTLLRGISAADTTLLIKDDTFYLLSNIDFKNNGAHQQNLSIYYSDDLLNGNFISHPQNPVCQNSRYTRMAGNIQNIDRNLYRISQNCEIIYGENMSILQIRELTKDKFSETFYKKIENPKDYICSHIYNSCNNFELIDGIKKEKNLFKLLYNTFRLFISFIRIPYRGTLIELKNKILGYSGFNVKLKNQDRRILEKSILPYINHKSQYEKVVFIGIEYYTKILQNKDLYYMEINKKKLYLRKQTNY